MKALIALALLITTSSYASITYENVDCYSDMSDGACQLTETETSYKSKCTIDVVLTLNNGEKVPTVLEGKGSVKKNTYALISNDLVKDRAMQAAGRDLYEKLNPFFSMKSCQLEN